MIKFEKKDGTLVWFGLEQLKFVQTKMTQSGECLEIMTVSGDRFTAVNSPEYYEDQLNNIQNKRTPVLPVASETKRPVTFVSHWENGKMIGKSAASPRYEGVFIQYTEIYIPKYDYEADIEKQIPITVAIIEGPNGNVGYADLEGFRFEDRD